MIMMEIQRIDNMQEKLQESGSQCHFSLLMGYISRPTKSDIRLSLSQCPLL